MKKVSKVLQVCSYYVVGPRLYQNLFDALDRLNIGQDVYAFTHRNHEIRKDYPPNVTVAKCYNKWDRLLFHMKHVKVLKDIKKMPVHEYDMMHAHSLFSNGYIAYKLNQAYDIPYVVAVQNTDVNVFFKWMIGLRRLGIAVLKNAARVIFASKPYLEYTIGCFVPEQDKDEINSKSVVIPYGVDTFWLQSEFRDRHKARGNHINLIYVGRIDANKNIEATAKACELLLEQGCEVSYTIVGEIEEPRYRKFISERSFIRYVPYCQMEELINHYRAADIFVMPSKYETFGLVYAEAMSQGLPIIYTRGQGFDGQFNEGEVGYSVQYDSPKEIADRVKEIVENYETISANCVVKSRRFNWDRIAKEYLVLYEEACCSRA